MLHITICYKLLAGQMLFKDFEEMGITGCKTGAVGRWSITARCRLVGRHKLGFMEPGLFVQNDDVLAQ